MSFTMQIIACFVATIFFAILLHQPFRTIIFSALIGTAGYTAYMLLDQNAVAYFAGTLIIAVLCEITARILKKAATIFLVSALIPIVPGIGLYRTMRYLVEDNMVMAAQVGSETILGVCAIALAITFSSIIFSNIHPARDRKPS